MLNPRRSMADRFAFAEIIRHEYGYSAEQVARIVGMPISAYYAHRRRALGNP